jgi:hypothetical protein
VIVRADVHGHLVLPTESLMGRREDWEELSKLHKAFASVIGRIKHLAGHGLSSMMVLHDFLLRRITLL